jgi:uncharacterized membrane protein YgdD (TMEM256/DUF423 family)
MKTLTLIFGAVYGMISVIMGAFGAHAFKKILSPERLESFETAVRYQMYHALLLLLIGFALNFSTSLEKWSAWLLIGGTFLFSATIYLLSFQQVWNVNLRFLGPLTPVGGTMLIAGWFLLILIFAKKF